MYAIAWSGSHSHHKERNVYWCGKECVTRKEYSVKFATTFLLEFPPVPKETAEQIKLHKVPWTISLCLSQEFLGVGLYIIVDTETEKCSAEYYQQIR
jgi:hypothetical protein